MFKILKLGIFIERMRREFKIKNGDYFRNPSGGRRRWDSGVLGIWKVMECVRIGP